jgi:hypothetical protein
MISKLVKVALAFGIVASIGAAALSNAEASRCYRGPGGWTYCR